MAEKTVFDLLGTNIDSAETKVFNATAVTSFQATGPNGEIIFDSTQQTLPGFIADTASLAITASYAILAASAISSSFASTSISSSFAATASLALRISASSINSNNSKLYGSSNIESIDWNARSTHDASNIKSINWDDRTLFDTSGSTVLNWTSGTLTVRLTSSGTTENTLTLGPPPAGGTGEGGQLGLQAAGGSYTSASFLDTWQDQFRILKGPNGGSSAGLMYMNLHTGNTQFVGAVTASAYNGLPNDYLYVTRNTNQTIGSGTWADRDIIFNNSVVSKGISYNTGTGLATLTGGKVYRITARLAWSAAASYLLQYSCYDSSNSQLGPTIEIVQSTNSSNNISDGTLDFIYAPGSNVDIKIRTTSGTSALSGEFIRGDLNTQLIIQQIA